MGGTGDRRRLLLPARRGTGVRASYSPPHLGQRRRMEACPLRQADRGQWRLWATRAALASSGGDGLMARGMAPASGRAVVQRVPGLLAVDLGVLVSTSSFLEALTTSGVCRRGARLAAGSRAWKRPRGAGEGEGAHSRGHHSGCHSNDDARGELVNMDRSLCLL
jgi:hypothetical protein